MNGYEAANVLVTLRGGGFEGAGEDPAPVAEQRDAYVAAGSYLDLAGSWTLGSFAAHLQTVDQWRTLAGGVGDGRALAQLVLRVGGAGSARSSRRVSRCGGARAGAAAADVRELARARRPAVGGHDPAADRALPDGRLQARRRGAVDAGDRRGAGAAPGWSGRSTSRAATAWRSPTTRRWRRCTRSSSTAFPEALFEDPHEDFEHLIPPDRLSFDAPIARAADVTTGTINVKPMRIGSLEPLLELYAHCDAARHRDVRRRDGRARDRARADRAAGDALSPGHAQRRRAVAVQRPRAAGRAAAVTAGPRLPAGGVPP